MEMEETVAQEAEQSDETPKAEEPQLQQELDFMDVPLDILQDDSQQPMENEMGTSEETAMQSADDEDAKTDEEKEHLRNTGCQRNS